MDIQAHHHRTIFSAIYHHVAQIQQSSMLFLGLDVKLRKLSPYQVHNCTNSRPIIHHALYSGFINFVHGSAGLHFAPDWHRPLRISSVCLSGRPKLDDSQCRIKKDSISVHLFVGDFFDVIGSLGARDLCWKRINEVQQSKNA